MAEKVVSTSKQTEDVKDIEVVKEKLEQFDLYKLGGPGLKSSTANHQTYITLALEETAGSHYYSVTAEIKPIVSSKLPGWLKKKPRTDVVVHHTALKEYIIQYGTSSRGKYNLHIQVNGSDIKGSPFYITTSAL